MPRIEILSKSSNTIDICNNCAIDIEEDDSTYEHDLDGKFPNSYIGSVEVEHPNYDDDDYKCFICDKILVESRDS